MYLWIWKCKWNGSEFLLELQFNSQWSTSYWVDKHQVLGNELKIMQSMQMNKFRSLVLAPIQLFPAEDNMILFAHMQNAFLYVTSPFLKAKQKCLFHKLKFSLLFLKGKR